jgi:hypothetical protein
MIIEHKINPYPRTMWVAVGEDFDKIKSEFQFVYESDSEMTNKKIVDEYDAIVFRVYKDNKVGFLVFIVTDDSNRTFVHEALHVALHIYEDCDMDLRPGMDQEPLCYLDEYIYSLIEADVQKYKALGLIDND